MSAEIYAPSEQLIEDIQGHFSNSDDGELIGRAWAFAESHYAALQHPAKKRYVEYVLGVAKILADLSSAPLVIAAAIVYPPLSQYTKVLPGLVSTFVDQPELIRLVEE